MDREDINSDQVRPRWFIDLDWYTLNNRSFSTVAGECLCLNCRRRLKVEDRDVPAANLLAAIKDCCSKEPDFFTGKLSILEIIFRLFLANGNQPLDLEELGKQLSERRERSPYHHSLEILSRLLENDRYYGIKQVAN